MIRVTVTLEDNLVGDVIIRPLLENTARVGMVKYAFVIQERNVFGEPRNTKDGIIEVLPYGISYIELLHIVLNESLTYSALIPSTEYEKNLIQIMRDEIYY